MNELPDSPAASAAAPDAQANINRSFKVLVTQLILLVPPHPSTAAPLGFLLGRLSVQLCTHGLCSGRNLYVSGDALTIYSLHADLLHALNLSLLVAGICSSAYLWPDATVFMADLCFNAAWFAPYLGIQSVSLCLCTISE